jgi:formamidopyrimidine-DNA glycosylase
MTGQLIFNSQENKHTHIIFDFEGGELFYNDVRKFGYVLYYESLAAAVGGGHFQKIGLEPFDKNFTLEYFKENIKSKNKNIKQILLDQSVVVGCGNIYADEVCFASKVLPIRNSKALTNTEFEKLYLNIKNILQLAIDMGGSSISDYKLSDGSAGGYAKLHKVYGKNNTPCSVCENILKKTLIAGRATVFCDGCQK